MALITFEDLPSTNTPLNATNLNNNFNYLDEKITLKTVYNNATGSNSGVTLSENINSAKFCIIQYRQEGYSEATKSDIVFPGETKHQLSFIHRATSGGYETLYNAMTYISLSGTSISVGGSSTALAINPNTSYGVSSNTVYITKVIAVF